MQILILTILQFSGSETFLPWQAFASIEKSEKLWNRFLHIVFPFFFFDVLRVMLRTITLSAILITKFIFLCVFITALIED